jgi:hypothetical protein
MPNYAHPARLEAIIGIASEMDLKVTYVHDDIIFIEHNNFLFVLDPDDDDKAYIRVNAECKPGEFRAHAENIEKAAGKWPTVKLAYAGRYRLEEGAEGEIQLVLLDEPSPEPGEPEGPTQ